MKIAVNAPKDCQKASFHLMPAPLLLLQSKRSVFHQKYFYFIVSTKQPSWVSCSNEKKKPTHICVVCIKFGDEQEKENGIKEDGECEWSLQMQLLLNSQGENRSCI